ncbi:hypothetical protein ACFL04_01555 [Patescibacteria group bacterium]
MNQKAFTHIVAVITISAIAITVVAAMVYFKTEVDKIDDTNTTVGISKDEPSSNQNTNQSIINTNVSVREDAIWHTYTNDFLGVTFKYPPDTEVKWHENGGLAGIIRIASEANPNKDSALYTDAVGPGSIGIVSYHFQNDLLTFAESMSGGLTPEPIKILGVDGYRIQGTHDANQTRVLGAFESMVDYYFFSYNAATWGIEFDAKTEFADQTPSHAQFLQLVDIFDFTVADKPNWPTQDNETYGFTFAYPPDWSITTCGSDYSGLYIDDAYAPICNAGGSTRINIKIFQGESTTESEIQSVADALNVTERTEITVGGRPATRVIGTFKDVEGPAPSAGTEAAYVFFDFGGDQYQLYYHGYNSISSLNTFNKIVDSLLFYR